MERRRRYPSIHHDSDISRPERRSKTLRGEGICICSPIDDDASRCRGCGRSAHLLGKGGREPPGSRQQPPNIYTTSRLPPWQGRKLRVLCALDFHGNSDPFPTALRASRSHTRCVVGWEQTIWAHPEPSHTIVDSRERRAPAQANSIAFHIGLRVAHRGGDGHGPSDFFAIQVGYFIFLSQNYIRLKLDLFRSGT